MSQVYVDGKPTGSVTPARVLQLAPGMHAVRLEPPAGLAPYEIKVYVSDNQVLFVCAPGPRHAATCTGSRSSVRDACRRRGSSRRSAGAPRPASA